MFIRLTSFLQDRVTCTTPTTRQPTTCFVLCVNPNSVEFRQRTWLVGFGSSWWMLTLEMLKDRNGKSERGEWMGADKNSIQDFSLWTRFHSYASTSFSCQVHSMTETLLLKKSSRQTIGLNRSRLFCLDSREEYSPREKLNSPSDRSPDSFHESSWDFGDRRDTSLATFARSSVPKTHLMK
jgi:hypothetical protein